MAKGGPRQQDGCVAAIRRVTTRDKHAMIFIHIRGCAIVLDFKIFNACIKNQTDQMWERANTAYDTPVQVGSLMVNAIADGELIIDQSHALGQLQAADQLSAQQEQEPSMWTSGEALPRWQLQYG